MQPEYLEESVTATVDVESGDTTSLLVDFLGEVLTRSHVHREAYRNVTFQTLTATSLRVNLTGGRVRGFGEDVKAVTYHEAEVVQRDGEWSTMLVLDI
jgi:SHS2 domain-containing protein